ncbi:hypothetical protein MJG53_017355 [Ovis ammon polii x Ovis aries]|uniref:Uncharacterized protein n=1 Tax=Ovis ammon polii x Ovis aries TaxID=2918886 RepID=A0ACB9U7Y3_9CETA|nr:hypothetical protein MJG53_017355 [Ovis ammon polii x Ovis aries]
MEYLSPTGICKIASRMDSRGLVDPLKVKILYFDPIWVTKFSATEKGPAAMLVLHFQEAIVLPLGQFEEKVAPTLQSHIVEVEREAQRWLSLGERQVPKLQNPTQTVLDGDTLALGLSLRTYFPLLSAKNLTGIRPVNSLTSRVNSSQVIWAIWGAVEQAFRQLTGQQQCSHWEVECIDTGLYTFHLTFVSP